MEGINNANLPNGLTEHTAEVFDRVSRLECIKGLYLCGGTGQSIQMNHRLSEDLDFELIGVSKDRPELDFKGIIKEVSDTFPGARTEILGDDQFHIFINNGTVKLSFFRPENPVKYIHEGFRYNNLVAPAYQDLLGMKLFTVCVRTKTRDFYDIFCLLEAGYNLTEAISYASHLSRHSFKSKDMMTRLITPQFYSIDEDFLKLSPRYEVTSEQIRQRMIRAIKEENIKKKPDNLGE